LVGTRAHIANSGSFPAQSLKQGTKRQISTTRGPWFWTITARFPQSTHDREYAANREQAMADFKARWIE